MSHLSEAEIELRDKFAQSYLRHQLPVMQRIERAVCGCDYGGTSWATRSEIDDIADRLSLGPGHQLMDLGAGAGWPGLYFAATTGCAVTLVDLPTEGLQLAIERAERDDLQSLSRVAVADGRALPFRDADFDAITHSDVLCCLPGKLEVLKECRRCVSDNGQMIFTVIYVAENLATNEHVRAVDVGPPYVEAATGYEEMLRQVGWSLIERTDLTSDFLNSAETFLHVDQANQSDLIELLGEADYQDRIESDRRHIDIIGKGHLRREIFWLRAQ